MDLAFKIVAVGALVAAVGWHYAGLIGLVLSAPAIGLAFSKNLVEVWEKLAERSRHRDAAQFGVWFERDVMLPIRRARQAAKEQGHQA